MNGKTSYLSRLCETDLWEERLSIGELEGERDSVARGFLKYARASWAVLIASNFWKA